MHDRREGDDAGEEVGVLDQGNGELDELGDVLGGLDGLCGVHVVGLPGGDGFVRSAGGDIPGYT